MKNKDTCCKGLKKRTLTGQWIQAKYKSDGKWHWRQRDSKHSHFPSLPVTVHSLPPVATHDVRLWQLTSFICQTVIALCVCVCFCFSEVVHTFMFVHSSVRADGWWVCECAFLIKSKIPLPFTSGRWCHSLHSKWWCWQTAEFSQDRKDSLSCSCSMTSCITFSVRWNMVITH